MCREERQAVGYSGMGLLAGPAFCAPPVSGVVRARPQKRRGYHPPRCCNVSSYAAVPLKTVLQEAIAALVPAVAPSSVTVEETTVGPGQLNEHYRLTAGNSGSFLVKVSRRGGMEALRGESLALSLLAEVCENDEELDVHVPLAVASIDSGLRAYSVLPWVDFAPFGSSISSVQKALGAGLARMHMRSVERLRHVHKERFGFPVPTWLGAAAQQNEWSMPGDWVGFFVSQRLRPRLDEAAQKFGHEWGTSNETVLALTTLGDRICNAQALQPLFADCDIAPALVHGDAFMGNTGAHGKSRTACLYDPAFVHRYSICLRPAQGLVLQLSD